MGGLALVTDRQDDPVDDIGRHLRERRQRFAGWFEQLRSSDPRFAEASGRRDDDVSEWHAAVYLLTGCDVVWARLGARVLDEASLECVVDALRQEEGWTPRQLAVMRWAVHFWDGQRHDPGGFPFVFGEFCFRRWVTAAHLHKSIAPALTIMDARRSN